MNKELYDVIYLSDKELGIGTNKNRPCIIIQIDPDDGDDNYVVPMTSKRGKDWDEGGTRKELSNGSFVDASRSAIKVTYNQIKYSDSAEDIELNWEDIEFISLTF